MLRRGFVGYVLLPVLAFVAYLLTVQILGANRHSLLFSENGVVELGTAACFFVAGGLALRLSLGTAISMPRRFRVLFSLFACAAWFVALEELSYGQHLFGWHPPAFFARHSTKHELNLHNLYGDGLSNLLRLVGNLAFPLCCIVLPLAGMQQKGPFSLGDWSFFLLPRSELIAVVILAQAMSPLDKLSKWLIGCSMLVRPGEIQELYWSVAALIYVCVIQQRLRSVADAVVLPFQPIPMTDARMRKAA